jgi:DNA-binding Lrp family transcriptional regulator
VTAPGPFDRDPALKLADRWQRGFPLCPRPFAAAGAPFDLTEAETLGAFARLIGRGFITRIGAVVRPNTAGASTLAALAVPPRDLDRVAAIVSAEPFVNHNYERDHGVNLWFVVAAPKALDVAATLARIAGRTGLAPLDLRLEQPYFLDLGFAMESGRRIAAPGAAARLPSAGEVALLAALEDGLAIAPRPYAELGALLGLRESEVIDRLAALTGSGIVSRLGCVVRHREVGYDANGMAVWDAPDAVVDAIGARLAAQEGVTLCYRRNRAAPAWPYNLFAMVHGRSEQRVRDLVASASAAAGLADLPHTILFSRRCFKQRGARFGRNPRMEAAE